MDECHIRSETIEKLRRQIDSLDTDERQNGRIVYKGQTYTWDQLLDNVEKCTPLGVRYALAFEKSLR